MTEKLILKDMNVPDGILHDSKLYNVSLENNELTLSFETHYYPEDYTTAEFAEKYKDFTKCHIKCRLDEENLKYGFDEVTFETSLNKKSIFKGIILSVPEFVELANKEIKKRKENGYHSWEYLDTAVTPNTRSVAIELSTYGWKYKGNDFHTCSLKLFTEEVEFIWE